MTLWSHILYRRELRASSATMLSLFILFLLRQIFIVPWVYSNLIWLNSGNVVRYIYKLMSTRVIIFSSLNFVVFSGRITFLLVPHSFSFCLCRRNAFIFIGATAAGRAERVEESRSCQNRWFRDFLLSCLTLAIHEHSLPAQVSR